MQQHQALGSSFMSQSKPLNQRGCAKLAQAVLKSYIDDMAPADGTRKETLEFYCFLANIDFDTYMGMCNNLY